MITEINYSSVNKNTLEDVLDGKIFKVNNYKNLKNYIQNIREEFNLDHVHNLNIQKCKNLNNKLLIERNNLKISSLFLDLIKKLIDNNSEFIQIETGMFRIVFDEMENKDEIDKSSKLFSIANSQGIYPQSFITNVNASPHRDLDRPHYSKQYNIWFSFYNLEEDESLIFFPESFKKDIKPNINQSYELDPNKDNFEIQKKGLIKNYNQLNLGKHFGSKLLIGDFFLFNSEHFHCSPIKKKNRLSCEVRFVDNCFDNNEHYRKNAFINIRNLYEKNKHDKYFTSLVDKTFENNQFYGFDYILNKIVKSKKENMNKKNIVKILAFISEKSNNFYLLGIIIDLKILPKYLQFKVFLKYQIFSLIFCFKNLDFRKNPINYFSNGHHPFKQPIPNKSIAGKISKSIILRKSLPFKI